MQGDGTGAETTSKDSDDDEGVSFPLQEQIEAAKRPFKSLSARTV